MKSIIKDKRGFTLIELIIAMAILGTVLAMASSIFIQASKVQNKIIKRVSYQDAATNIVTTIKSNIMNTNYLTITSSAGDGEAALASGEARFYVKGDYDGFYMHNSSSATKGTKMYGIKDLKGAKLKLNFTCEPVSADGRYSVLTVNMAFYDAVIENSDITADTANAKALYTHNASMYLQNLGFGIKISDNAIEAQKNADGYDSMSDTLKEAYESNLMNDKASGFVGQCIKYKKMN